MNDWERQDARNEQVANLVGSSWAHTRIIYIPLRSPLSNSSGSHLVQRVQVPLVGTERTLDSLSPVVAAEFPRDIDCLFR